MSSQFLILGSATTTANAATASEGDLAVTNQVPLKVTKLPNWTKLWDQAGATTTRALTSDGIFSVPLTENDSIGSATAASKTMILHSDSLIGTVNPSTLTASGTFVNNYIDLLTGNTPDPTNFSQVWGARGNMNAGTGGIWGNGYWIGDGVTVGSNVYFSRYTSCCAWQTTGSDLVKVPIVNGAVDYAHYTVPQTNTQLFNDKNNVATTWGSAIMANTTEAGAPNPDGYIYFYGYRFPKTNTWQTQPVVARVLPADIEDTTKFTFWTGTEWSSTSADANVDAASIGPFHPWQEMSVTPIPSGIYAGKYMFIYDRGGISTTLEYSIGDTPTGPFSPGVAFYDTQETWTYGATSSTVAYNPKAHPALSPAGHLYVTYNVNPIAGGGGTSEIYRPRWLDIDLNTLAAKPILANKSTQQPATASGSVAGQGPEYAEVGSVFNKWAEVGSGNHWLTIDLGATYYVSKYGLRNAGWHETAAWNTRDWQVQVSPDNSTWTTVDSVTGNAATVVTRTFAETPTRYVRLYITAGTQSGQDGAARIYGFDVYGALVPVTDNRPDLALNKPVTVSGSASTACAGSKLVDGKWSDATTDKWCDTTAGDKWAVVDLGGYYDLDRWVVHNASVAGEATRWNTNYYTLQTSLDGTTWTDADVVDYNLEAITDRPIDKVKARYARLHITKPALSNDTSARIQELSLYGQASVGQLNVFVRGGTDGALYERDFDGSAWSTSWTNLGGPNSGTFRNAPATVSANGSVRVFVRGTDGALWTRTYTKSTATWSSWSSLGGLVLDSPAASVDASTGVISLFVRGGSDGALYRKTFDGTSWTANWTNLGGPNSGTFSSAPATASSNGTVRVVVRGTDNAVWTRTYTTSTATWSSWSSLGGLVLDSPAASVDASTGVISLFVRGGSDGALYRKTFDGTSWTANWTNLGGPNSGTFSSAPATASSNGTVRVVVRGTDNAVWTRTYTTSTATWSSWSSLGGLVLDSPGAAIF